MLNKVAQKILNLPQQRGSIWLIPLLTLLIYANTLFGAFQFDDITSILENEKIRNLWDIQQWWSFNSSRPVGYFTFALNYSIHQYHVFGYHLLNISIHALNGILVLLLLKQILRISNNTEPNNENKKLIYIPFAGAILFTAHPLCTEAVSYITQRLVSLATLFYLCSIFYYIKARGSYLSANTNTLLNSEKQKKFVKNSPNQIQAHKQTSIFIACCILFALLAVFTKEIAYTLPLTILTLELLLFQNLKSFSLKKIMGIIAFLLLFISIIAIFTKWQKYLIPIPPVEGNSFSISPQEYLFTQFRVIVTYIRLFFLPYGQHLDYYYPLSYHFLEIKTIFSFLFLLTIMLFAIYYIRKNKLIALGIFWFFITLLPQSSLFARPNLIFEHRAYLPIIGIIIAIAGFISHLKINKEKYKTAIPLFFTAIILLLSVLTYMRNEKWKTAYSLWRDCYRKSPQKPRVCNNMGQIMHQYKKYDAAISFYNKALQHNPKYAEVFYNRSRVYADLQQLPLAIHDLDSALLLKPDYYAAYNNKAILIYRQADTMKAIEILSFVILNKPNNIEALTNRAIIYAEKQEWEKAYTDISQAAKLDKSNTELKQIKNDIWKNLQQTKNLIIPKK